MRAAAVVLACAASVSVLLACNEARSGGTARPASHDRSLVRAPDPPRGPFEALVTAGGLTTRGYPSSSCLRSSHGASCVDALPPGPSAPVLPVKAESLVGITLGAAARSLSARLVRL